MDYSEYVQIISPKYDKSFCWTQLAYLQGQEPTVHVIDSIWLQPCQKDRDPWTKWTNFVKAKSLLFLIVHRI